jgi:hypothetical protein
VKQHGLPSGSPDRHSKNLIPAQPFEQAVGELTSPLLLGEKEPNWDVVVGRVYTAIVRDGTSLDTRQMREK